MAVARTLNVPDAGTRRLPSIDKGIWGYLATSAFARVSHSLGAGSGLLQFLLSAGDFPDRSEAVTLGRHFCARNAPYGSNESINPLKLQQNGAPSERGLSAFSITVPSQCLRRRPCLVELSIDFTRSNRFDEFNPDKPFAIDRNRMRASFFGSA
jgi:hypothetical protein